MSPGQVRVAVLTAAFAPGVAGALFLALKLTGAVDWPWLAVLSPYWASLAAGALVGAASRYTSRRAAVAVR